MQADDEESEEPNPSEKDQDDGVKEDVVDVCDPKEQTESLVPFRFYSPRECARLMGFPEAFVINKTRHVNTFFTSGQSI